MSAQAIDILFYQVASGKNTIATRLTEEGFSVHTADSPQSLSAAIRATTKIAILDLSDSQDEVCEVAQSLRKQYSELQLIVMYSESMTPKLDALIPLGLSSIVSVPTENIHPLKLAIENLCELIEARQTIAQQATELEQEVEDKKLIKQKLAQVQEAALEATQVKSQFLANMSHEIRTPMNGVIGMTMLLLRTELDKRQRRYSETIRSSGESLLTVIDDILDFSRIGSGKLNLQKIDFHFARTVEDVCEQLIQKAQEKGLEIICRLPPSFPPTVQGDPGRLRQVLSNLIANSIKFTERGTILIEVTLEEQVDYNLLVKISVRDTGIGIPEDALHRLFNSFEQVDGSSARKHGGTGLGLAICNQLVELMGGRLGVKSQEGQGSTFWFTIPLTRCNKTPNASPQNPEALRGLRLLIADDNPTVRQLLKEQAESWNMEIATAPDGSTALRILEEAYDSGRPFDLLTLDWRMPDMSGIDVARQLKTNPKLQQISPIMITAFPQRGHGELAQKAGFAGYLVKPVPGNQLRDCFLTVIHRSASDKSLVTRHSLEESQKVHEVDQLHRPRVLVAEDNFVNQEVTVEILDSLGFRSEIAPDGKIALEMHAEKEYSVILMDCMMPNLNGYDATKAIRLQEGAEGRHTPIIGVTANAMSGDREKCLTAGMDDYLAKPITPTQLLETMRKWIKIPAPKSEPTEPDEQSLAPVSSRSTRMVALYLRDLPIRITELKKAIQDADAGKLESEAHNLKGASLVIGAPKLVRLARDLEQTGASTLMETASATLEDLIEESKRVEKELSLN